MRIGFGTPGMKIMGLAATLLVAACIPSKRPPPRPPARKPPAAATATDPSTLQCLADLRKEDVRFSALPDRTFKGGCTALGSVQLLDIGTPVTNLGAMTCPLARNFIRWTREAVQPAAHAWLSSRIVKIETFGTYSCRPLNGAPGQRLSEHGRANAVDISAFVTADGRRITVLDAWNGPSADARNFLRAVHQAGCRRFQVVLGPQANALHRNHFHFDMGAGPYCR